MKTILGIELSAADQQQVLRVFVHRFTRDHKPSWAGKLQAAHGRAYPVQFASDAEWLANTRFVVRKDGSLNLKHLPRSSSPTWPDNPELRK